MLEPPAKPFGIDTFGVNEKNRIVMADADIRVDISNGDLNQIVLRKINFTLKALQSFNDEQVILRAIRYLIEDVSNYGEPEGLGILKICYLLHGRYDGVLEQLFQAADNIGTVLGMKTLLSAYISEPTDNHLEALHNFAWWFPGVAPRIATLIEASPLPRHIVQPAVDDIMKYDVPEPNGRSSANF